MNSDSIQGTIKIKECTLEQSKKSIFGKTEQKIDGKYLSFKYDFNIKYQYEIFKKNRIPLERNLDLYLLKMNSPEKYQNKNLSSTMSLRSVQMEDLLLNVEDKFKFSPDLSKNSKSDKKKDGKSPSIKASKVNNFIFLF